MIDFQKSKVRFTTEEWTKLSESLNEFRQSRNRFGGISIEYYNLRLTYWPNMLELQIAGSMHKFYNAVLRQIPLGLHNYDDFTSDKLLSTLDFLCEKLGKQPKDIEFFSRFEYGVNLKVASCTPQEFTDSYISLGTTRINKFFPDNPHKGKPLGKLCYFTDYRVKFYDKSKQAELPIKGILRYEIVNNGIGRLKRLLGKDRVTYSDFYKPATLKILGQDLIKKFDRIRKLPISHDLVSEKELQRMIGFSEPKMREYYKSTLSIWKFNEMQKANSELMHDLTMNRNSPHFKLRVALIKTVEKLTNSTTCHIGVQQVRETTHQ